MLRVTLRSAIPVGTTEKRADETMVECAVRSEEHRDMVAALCEATSLNEFRERVMSLRPVVLEDENGLQRVRRVIRDMCAEGLLDARRESEMLSSARFTGDA